MSRIEPLNAETAAGQSAEILNNVKKKMGMVPNIVATMANSPAVAKAYLGLSGELAGGLLPNALREQIALTVGQANRCNYCLSAHSALAKGAGVSDDEIINARKGQSTDAKSNAAIEFARKIVDSRGNITDEDFDAVRAAGYRDGEISEIVANVALNIFTNYFNHVTDPEIDFPKAPELEAAPV